MNAEGRELQPVTGVGRRQTVVSCPRCREAVGLWLCILPPGEYLRLHPATDLTASLLPPERRAAAMKHAADMSTKSTATPWVTCTFCGYDDQYVIPAPKAVSR